MSGLVKSDLTEYPPLVVWYVATAKEENPKQRWATTTSNLFTTDGVEISK